LGLRRDVTEARGRLTRVVSGKNVEEGGGLIMEVGGGQPLSFTLSSGEISQFDVQGETHRCDWNKKPHTPGKH
jgi:hypothetical protein